MQNSLDKLRAIRINWQDPRVQALIFSQIMAVIWWIVSQGMRETGVIVWYDQQHIFRRSVGFS